MDYWKAEKKVFERMFRALLKRPTHIVDIPKTNGEIGFTSSGGNIYLAKDHEIMGGLNEDERKAFRMGVFAHETLHQLFTDFSFFEATIRKYKKPSERKVVQTFCNLVEDPAIEYFAPCKMGGKLLESLKYMIRTVYIKSPGISDSPSAFTQLLNSLVEFGDMGIVKGTFTYPEAFEYFKKLAPEFNAAILIPSSRDRIKAAERWMDMTRPLWEPEAKEQEEFMKELQDLLDSLQSSEMNGSGGQEIDPEDMKGSSSDASERRGKIPASSKDSEDSDGKPGGESDSKTGAESGEETNPDGKDETEDSDSDRDDMSSFTFFEDEDGDVDSVDLNGNDGEDNKDTDTKPGEDAGKPNGPSGDVDTSGYEDFIKKNDEADEIVESSTELTDETINEITSAIDEEIHSEEMDAARQKKEAIDFDVSPETYGSIRCLNEKVTSTSSALLNRYNRIMEVERGSIRNLTNSLKRIFANDMDEEIHSTSGKYNIKRGMAGTTAKIFDKKKEKKNAGDMEVLLLVDESGSMCGDKEVIARESAIVIAETFANLKIPCSVIGFTADTQGYDVVHHHYVSWKNTKAERIALANIHAQANNLDGYSIRYVTRLLKNRSAEHKLLFVISDGYPAACGYGGMSEGVADTTTAIMEAKKVATVFGIGIGDCAPEILSHMYKESFIHVREIEKLSFMLAKQLKRVIKNF